MDSILEKNCAILLHIQNKSLEKFSSALDCLTDYLTTWTKLVSVLLPALKFEFFTFPRIRRNFQQRKKILLSKNMPLKKLIFSTRKWVFLASCTIHTTSKMWFNINSLNTSHSKGSSPRKLLQVFNDSLNNFRASHSRCGNKIYILLALDNFNSTTKYLYKYFI